MWAGSAPPSRSRATFVPLSEPFLARTARACSRATLVPLRRPFSARAPADGVMWEEMRVEGDAAPLPLSFNANCRSPRQPAPRLLRVDHAPRGPDSDRDPSAAPTGSGRLDRHRGPARAPRSAQDAGV